MDNKNNNSRDNSFNVFHSMVKNLSEYERNNLLSKLVKYSNDAFAPYDKDQKNKSATLVEHEALVRYAKNVFENYSLLRKIMIYFSSFFRSCSVEDTVINNELATLKRSIENGYAKYINFSENKIRPAILEKLVPIMREITFIKKTLNGFFDDKVNYFEFVVYVIEREKAEDIAGEIDGLAPDSLENSPALLEKSNYLTEKEKRLKQFFAKINSFQLIDINKEFASLDVFFKLINYEFSYLANLFSFTDIEQPYMDLNELYISDDIVTFLERLYRLLISIDPSLNTLKVFGYFTDYLKIYLASDMYTDEDAVAVKESMTRLLNGVEDAKNYFPYEKFIKYKTGNILKYIKSLDLKINLIEMYKTYKRTVIDKLWDSRYQEIKARNVHILINKLFGEYDFNSLTYFDKYFVDKLERYSGLKVKDFYRLNMLHRFISTIYLEKIAPVVNKMIIDGDFIKDIVKSNFSTSYYSLKSGQDKITLFDLQFKDESPLRRKINNTLVKMAAEPNFKTILLNIVNDVNEESSKLSVELSEAIKQISSIFRSLAPEDGLRQKVLVNFDELKVPLYGAMSLAVEKINRYFADFVNVYKLIEETF